ncbi:MAG: glycosyltransferase family 2 protein [Lachnospiraceae bacterium]|nr:glycosyltransferase family 2 protein [Lachnospiraceae bacterium]
MEFTEKISVIIPTYNMADTLVRAAESVCTQTYPASLTEVIIVDNGSTDETPRVAKELSEKYPQLRVIRREEGDVSAARNAGIREATGAYLGFVDSDDYVMPEMYELLMAALMRHGTAMAQVARREVSPAGEALEDMVVPPAREIVTDTTSFLKTLLLHEGDTSFCTKLIARELFTEETMFPEGVRNEDFRLMIRMLGKTDRIVCLPERCYHVVHVLGSGSRPDPSKAEVFPPGFAGAVEGADEAEALVAERYPQFTEIARRFALVQRLDYLLHIPVSQMTADNDMYRGVVRYVKAHRAEIKSNSFLTEKEQKNLRILSFAPKLSRRAHKLLMKLR